VAEVRFDGFDAAALAARLAVPACEVYETVSSTMDVAHAAAGRGASAGTVILADAQEAGRGRGGKRWASLPGRGVWMTLIERPESPRGLDVLSLRLGLHAAEALDRFAEERVRLKWPNDLYVGDRKLGGILVEARWRDQRVEWVAIGIGLNVAPPGVGGSAAGLAPGTTRIAVLELVLPALRAAAATEGPLTSQELARYAVRDLAAGRRIVQPAAGVVAGLTAAGELLVETGAGRVACCTGSLVFAEEA
jgi:BirA family transcriptional regulator, biotin operon repressor / biotin---[acetyl-CoA-carboxylase] ligase